MEFSDGIARVHGMNNVQAEELVEYVAIAIIVSNLLGATY